MATRKSAKAVAVRDLSPQAQDWLKKGIPVTPDGEVDWGHIDVEIRREGTEITLPDTPDDMPLTDAIAALERRRKDEETFMDVQEMIAAFPLEGAVAFVSAMRIKYGWASPTPKKTWWGEIPPDMMSVEIDAGKFIQIPWGEFTVPGIERPIGFNVDRKRDGQLNLLVYGQVRKREQTVLLELAKMARDILRDASIYKGKAIHIATNKSGNLELDTPPTFVDLKLVKPEELVVNRDIQEMIDTNINAPIMHTEAVRNAGIPLKRGVLLEGKYGVGKTMLTQITAKHCRDNGWTFIIVDRGDSLKQALTFAKRYQPAVVFCEDIDRSMSERSDKANDLLNVIDGVVSKTQEIMVVLTTNHIEKITQAMLRPGRLDAVISILPPDEESVGRLIRLYSRGLIADGEDLLPVGEVLKGNIPAVIREVTERSKLAMIAHGNDDLHAEDLLVAANGMKNHLDLLRGETPKPTFEEELGGMMVRAAAKGAEGIDPADLDSMNDTFNNMNMSFMSMMGQMEDVRKIAKSIKGSVSRVDERTVKIDQKTEEIGEDTDDIKDAVNA